MAYNAHRLSYKVSQINVQKGIDMLENLKGRQNAGNRVVAIAFLVVVAFLGLVTWMVIVATAEERSRPIDQARIARNRAALAPCVQHRSRCVGGFVTQMTGSVRQMTICTNCRPLEIDVVMLTGSAKDDRTLNQFHHITLPNPANPREPAWADDAVMYGWQFVENKH